MAITKAKKHELVDKMSELFASSKLTVIVNYKGTPVKAMQALRRAARENGTQLQVVKNRLVKKALETNGQLKGVDTSALTGMLMYAFNEVDEAAPAQVLADFAKTQPTLEFVGAITADGQLMSAADVATLSKLPGKQQLRAQLLGTLSAPFSGFVGVLSGNLRGVMNVLNARAESIK